MQATLQELHFLKTRISSDIDKPYTVIIFSWLYSCVNEISHYCVVSIVRNYRCV